MNATLESYDDIPYQGVPLPESRPDHLAVIGHLLGLDGPDPATARVLELGCAAGENLLPLAWYRPGGTYLGLDLSREQVAHGQRLIDRLGLANATLRHADIMQVDARWGTFDYIIVHGVWSWVPEAVRTQILALCQTCLAPNGIAYISYNTLPGWRLRGMVRDMLLYHVRDETAPRQRLQRARELIALLAEAPGEGALGEALQRELRYLTGVADSYLYHEYLESENRPVLFTDFIAAAGQHGLRYLADAELHTMFASDLTGPVAGWLQGVSEQIEQEQYLDFLRHRFFRRSLLVHDDRRPDYEIDLQRLWPLTAHGLWWPDGGQVGNDDQPQIWRNEAGEAITVADPLVKAALGRLTQAAPAGLRVDRLYAEALEANGASDTEGLRAAFLEALFNLFATQAVSLVLTPIAPVPRRRVPRSRWRAVRLSWGLPLRPRRGTSACASTPFQPACSAA